MIALTKVCIFKRWLRKGVGMTDLMRFYFCCWRNSVIFPDTSKKCKM